MIDKNIIKETVYNIIPAAIIEQIILFGSHARGDADEDSDIDICVIVSVEPTKDEVKLYRREICNALVTKHRTSVDLLIKTNDSYNKYKNVACTIERSIAAEGVSL